MLYLLLLFTIVPLVELWLLVRLSGVFGFWTTIAVVLGTGVLGASLARWQGWLAMARVQNEMRQGLLPARALGDGALILVAGALLITPGVLTDILGLALLLPPFRKLILKLLRYWFARNVHVQTSANFWHSSSGFGFHNRDDVVDATIIEPEDSQSGPSRTNAGEIDHERQGPAT